MSEIYSIFVAMTIRKANIDDLPRILQLRDLARGIIHIATGDERLAFQKLCKP